MKVALLGGGGFLGSYLAGEFESRGHTVRIFDPMVCLSDCPEDIRKKAIGWRAGLHKGGIIEKKIEELTPRDFDIDRPDIIVMLAATPIDKPDSEAISKRQIEVDIALTNHALKLAKQIPTARFVFMSSVFAYGDFEWATAEDRLLNPKTPYGIAKAMGEVLTRLNSTNYNIIRTTSVYGMGDWNWRGTQIFVNRLLRGEQIWVNDTWLDFIYVKDLVRGIADVALSDHKNEAFHISGGKALSLVDFAEELKKYFPDVTYDKVAVQDRPKRGTMDNTKARMLLGWQPRYDLEAGVKDYMSYALKENFG